MPFQPTNPYPYNTGVEKDDLVFRFELDPYDYITEYELYIYDFNDQNKELYKIHRYVRDGEQKATIYGGESDVTVRYEYEDSNPLPIVGGRGDNSIVELNLSRLGFVFAKIQDNKTYTWNVKLINQNYNVWITTNNTYADSSQSLIYVPNNSKMQKGQLIKFSDGTKKTIDTITRDKMEGNIYYRQSASSNKGTIRYYCDLGGSVTATNVQQSENGIRNTNTFTMEDEARNYIKAGETKVTFPGSSTPTKTYKVIEIDLSRTPATITLNEAVPGIPGGGIEAAMTMLLQNGYIHSATVPDSLYYSINKSTRFKVNSTQTTHEITEISKNDNTITFKPEIEVKEEGYVDLDITLTADAKFILRDDLNENTILIVGDKADFNKFQNTTGLHITLNYINEYEVEDIQVYSEDVSLYKLKKDKCLYLITTKSVITPTNYQVKSRELEKPYSLERYATILTVDSDLGSTIPENTNFTIYDNSIISPIYYFSIASLGEVKVQCLQVSESEEKYYTTNETIPLNSSQGNFVVEIDSTQGEGVRGWYWELQLNQQNIITTNWNYSSYITFEYLNFLPTTIDANYELILHLKTTSGREVKYNYEIEVDYVIDTQTLNPILSIDCDRRAVKLDYQQFKTNSVSAYYKNILIAPDADGKYLSNSELGYNNNYFSLNKDSISFLTSNVTLQWLQDEQGNFQMPSDNVEGLISFNIPKDYNDTIVTLDFKNQGKINIGYNGQDIEGECSSYFYIQKYMGTSASAIYAQEGTLYDNYYKELQALDNMGATVDEDQIVKNYYYFDFRNVASSAELNDNNEGNNQENSVYFNEGSYYIAPVYDSTSFLLYFSPSMIRFYKKSENTGDQSYTEIATFGTLNLPLVNLNLILHGNTQISYSYAWLKNFKNSNGFFDDNSESNDNFVPKKTEWDRQTLFLVHLNEKYPRLDGGNVDNTEAFDSFIISRASTTDINNIQAIAKLPKGARVFYDYSTSNRMSYQYYITPYSTQGSYNMSAAINPTIIQGDKNQIHFNYDYVSVFGTQADYNSNFDDNINNSYKIENENATNINGCPQSWFFSCNVDESEETVNNDVTLHENITAFPRLGISNRHYHSGTIKCMLGNYQWVENQFGQKEFKYVEDTIERKQYWEEFCNNGRIKILRDSAGNIIPVFINPKSIKYHTNYKPHFTELTFEWTQIGPNNAVLYGDDSALKADKKEE